MEYNLGQSNSKVEIVSFNKSICVKKTSKDSRFKSQYEKHKKALLDFCNPIKVPKILSGFDNNSYHMEYILGKTLGHVIDSASPHLIKAITNQIGLYFKNLILKSTITDSRNFSSPILEKLESIEEKLLLSRKLDKSIIKSAIELQLKNLNFVEPIVGFNHGDFSFENLIVTKEGNIYLIDFLDSPIDSPYIDFGRLYLDSSMGWWNSKNSSFSQSQNQIYFESLIIRIFEDLKISQKSLNFFKIFALLRIIPYTKNPTRLGHLKLELHNFLNTH